MDKAAVHYTSEELNEIIGQDLVIEFIYNVQDGLYMGLNGIITGVHLGDNAPNIPASIDFVPTEQSAFNAEVGNVDLPNNIAIIRIRNIRV